MRVPVRVYGSEALISEMRLADDLTLAQGRNVATLPGIRKFAVILPDGHQGYGFPIGGVAAVDPDAGVISPGGIGFDINCGVRLLRTPLRYADIQGNEQELVDRLYETIPCGLGKGGYLNTDRDDLLGILAGGLEWMRNHGYATQDDIDHCEENGRLEGNPNAVPAEALARGHNQVGSLGSGNHFLEVQRVADVYDAETAAAFGIEADRIVVMIHSGSRGLGHQTCTEYIRRFERAFPAIADSLPDRQLIYAPLSEEVAARYKGAMYAAANFAWANRQAMTEGVREVFADLFGVMDVELVYDVCHNIAKEERHRINGGEKTVLVHRKGATRAFPAGRPEVPAAYRDVGQPVFIPGSMGTSSYVLCGGERSLDRTFGSTAHGAGRMMSRTQAKREYTANELQRTLREQGIYVRARSGGTLTEEAPGAYKDIDEVIRVSDALNIGTKVARMRPVANIKG
ncbi:RtcB family protein [Halobaculum limi]|uniref:RtcB family protein n=1 Tax=Halobaculum limi TaxID=3031916 RepID=UPI003D811C9A